MALGGVYVPPKPAKKGGGGIGSLVGAALGAVVGGAAAPFTGGASIPVGAAIAGGALAGSGTGMGLGQMVGESISQSQGPQERGGLPLTDVADRRMRNNPRASLARLNEALAELPSAPQDIQSIFGPFLIAAQQRNKPGVIG